MLHALVVGCRYGIGYRISVFPFIIINISIEETTLFLSFSVESEHENLTEIVIVRIYIRIYSFIFCSLYCVIIFELDVLRLLIFIKFRNQI